MTVLLYWCVICQMVSDSNLALSRFVVYLVLGKFGASWSFTSQTYQFCVLSYFFFKLS